MFETIEEDGAVRHLVFGCMGDEFPDYFSVGMLKENTIRGIISPSVVVRNGMDYYRYDISDSFTLREYLLARLSRRQLLAVFEGILETLQELESYLLDISLLFTDLDHIFIKNDDNRINMLYLPFYDDHQPVHDLFKEIIFNAGFIESGDGSYVTVILNALNDASEFKVRDFEAVIRKLGGKERKINVKKYAPYEISEAAAAATAVSSVMENEDRYQAQDTDYHKSGYSFVKKIKSLLFGDSRDKDYNERNYTVTEDNSGPAGDPYDYPEKTVMLTDGESMIAYPYLIRSSTGEKIVINTPVFRIGKDSRYADHVISDNAAVSRAHVEFTVEDDTVYIRDEESLNHTFVNGIRISSTHKNILNDKDVVILADEEFIFYR